LVTDEEQSPEPWAVLTGDTLFVGDVGRPDLSKIYPPEALAGMLYDSLHGKLLKLPDGVIVYPGHGAGSLCGRSLGNARFSTIRMERLTNYAIQINTKEEFIQQLTTNLPPRPEYFPQAAQINRSGAPSLAHLPRLKPISATILKSLLDRGGVALDVRGGNEFAASHVPGSINIPLSGQFAPWAGALLGLSSQPVLVADSPEQLDESRVRLARIGIDDLGGYLEGGVEGWTRDGLALEVLQQISVQNLSDLLQRRSVRVLDVRRLPECRQGHIDSATTWALDQFRTSLPDIDRGEPIAIICQGGYRSAIASSFLMRAGFRSISNVRGGFDAWRNAGFPWVGEEATAVLTA
jgi:rhodanese-related sulfurtransferase